MNHTVVCLSALSAVIFTMSSHAAEPDTKGAEKLGWKLALQSWTTNKMTLVQSLDVCKKLGIKYIEVYPGQSLSPDDKSKFDPKMTDAQIKMILDKAKASGVQIIDCGVIGIPAKEEEARKVFDWAKKVGITILVSEPDPKALPMIDKLAGEFGIKVAIHDHPKPSKYWDPEFVYANTKDLKHVSFCADVGHWKRSGLEPGRRPEAVRRACLFPALQGPGHGSRRQGRLARCALGDRPEQGRRHAARAEGEGLQGTDRD